ncbi:reverse transcriptase family protein [Pseudomonas syringae pv. syringae]|uniref:reverse transcriptase family protein n=1 Tax=Pseudomonas TaxID=286 RepID=UPI001F11036A|nr:reverse transcriptase family protein [Pseudomonas syringae]MCH5500961.1 reverse transcriptase family protein [Pseudomonas syringae pv. syringae]MCH5526885.1 reverse transcriptase family protein [Pseudomonas syringae pv. syringae]MCH5562020.1 reverse transcriptase family protein [Pseudomonas syringae pv. syringae]MCH5567162.1 reverse transcriptase family protein [Pseudomonas syringae pv. syringae]MCH5595427.1 reverse transcriptase family protein [Pseudomonas syringae pv. syringae]
MKQKRKKSVKRERKSYDICQSALYNTSTKSKLASLFSIGLHELRECIGDYRQFQLIPEPDPFKAGKLPKARQVQKPSARLLVIHEQILKLLRCVRVPEYMQFALKGTSYKINAESHLSKNTVATLDIRNFFGSTSKSKVFNFFKEDLKAPGDVANLYADLITFENCLPTGSPLSPLISFYANKNLYEDINNLAKAHNLKFTCYVDDLTFSGDKISSGFMWQIEEAIAKYGHVVARDKTKIYKNGRPAHITGVIVHDGVIRVPNARHRKMRLIKAAIARGKGTHGFSKKELEYKLGGLLGEAAYLDPSHLPAAIEFNKSVQRYSLVATEYKSNRPETGSEQPLDSPVNLPWD